MSDNSITRRDHTVTFTRPTTDTHTFHLQPFKGFRLEVDDIHFHLDSAVFLPALGVTEDPNADPSVGLGAAAEALLQIKKFPKRKVLLCGHADTSGDAGYNIGLSVKRVKCTKAVILGERDEFVSICKGKHKNEDIDHILTWVDKLYGWECNPKGQGRYAATKKFQKRYNIEWEASIGEDGGVGTETWGAFFDVYQDMIQNLVQTDDAGFKQLRDNFIAAMHSPGAVGCGEEFPLPKNDPAFGGTLSRPRDNYRSQADRRTEILFFDPGQEPKMDCHPGGDKCVAKVCEVYNTKMYTYTPIDVPDSLPRHRVYLKLVYLDPEDPAKLHPFPKDFPVIVRYKDGTEQEEKVGGEGLLEFGALRRKGKFSLLFKSAEPLFIAVSADDKDNKLAKKADLPKLHQDKFRFFSVPKEWTLVESKWEVAKHKYFADDPDYEFFMPGRYGRTIGTSGAPVEMKLDPHWSFVRFEFFDRRYGHGAPHNHERVNIPATLIGGWRNSPAGAGDPDTSSHWTVLNGDIKRCAHAIPWILQKKSDNSADPRPDKNIQLEMKSDWLHASDTLYVVSKSANERVIESRADGHADLKPSEKRLDFYDLPKLWRSHKYFTRFADKSGDFFDNAAAIEPKIKDSLKAPAKPLIFSLDDMVLVDSAFAEITLGANEQPAIFFHQFKDPGVQFNGKSISPVGVYSPGAVGAAAAKPYYPFSDTTMPRRHVVTDYPNWVRLVIAQGNMFDVFDRRTPDGDRIVGARAAVRWVDANPGAVGVTAGGSLPAPVARTDQPATDPFFSIEPFFQGRTPTTRSSRRAKNSYQEWSSPFASSWSQGRFDMVLLRDCDVAAGKEIAINIHFFKFQMDFTNAPAAKMPVSNDQYRKNVVENIPVRWNGPDTWNPKVPKFLADDVSKKIEGRFFWFVQDVPAAARHFKVDIVDIQRAFMQDANGTSNFSPDASTTSATTPGWFTAAHECGHADGMFDEYNERSSLCSYRRRSLASWISGDPYENDQRAIMRGNIEVRSRHRWHATEWMRGVTKLELHVDLDGRKYRLPHHPTVNPQRTYMNWPIAADIEVSGAISGTIGIRRKFDIWLWALGADAYANSLVSGKDLRGLMVVDVKMEVAFDDPSVKYGDLEDGIRDMDAAVDGLFNEQTKMVVNNATVPGAGVDLSPCAVLFKPRFLVPTFPSSLGNDAMKTRLKDYFNGLSISGQTCPAADPARTTYLTNTAPGQYTTLVNTVRTAQGTYFLINVRGSYTSGWQGNNASNRLRLEEPDHLPRFFGDMLGLEFNGVALPVASIKQRALDRIVKRLLPNATLA